MSLCGKIRHALTCGALAALASFAGVPLAGQAGAVTFNESTIGDFSDNFATPFAIPPGADVIAGTNNAAPGRDLDFVVFENLAPGAQTLAFTFTLDITGNQFASGGGQLLWREDPFPGQNNAPNQLGFNVQGPNNTEATLNIPLAESFAGDLYVQITINNGLVSYNIDAPGNAAAIPLPPSMLLLLAGLGLLGLQRRMA